MELRLVRREKMMKIIVDLMSLNVELYGQADGLIVNSQEFSCFNGFVVDVEDLEKISFQIKNCGKIAILNVDQIIAESILDSLESYLEKTANLFDYFIYSDMAVYSYFRERNQLDKLIYNAKTIIASSYDLAYYNFQQVKCFLNNELSFAEITEIAPKEKFSFEVYGYHQIFYSERELLSLYQEFSGKADNMSGKLLLLKEELRNDRYKIYQGLAGTFIYTPYIYAMFEEILGLKDSLDFIRINGIFLSETTVLQVLNCYAKLVAGEKVSREDLYRINENISGGFLENKSVLLKAELDPNSKKAGS